MFAFQNAPFEKVQLGDAVLEPFDVESTTAKFDLGRERWDLITAFYMHGWYHLSKLPTAKRLRDALRPGGLLVIEGFAGGQTGFQTNELLRDFAELRVLRYEDVQDEADWSPGRKSRIIRIVAEKAQ